jgi:hypothetical protein
LLDDTPTSKALGVFIGMAELNGTAESAQPLSSNLVERACVLYNWGVEEAWSRTETSTDSKGNSSTTTKSGWTTIASGGKSIPFYLQDDTGVILIRPEGAKVEPDIFCEATVEPDDPLYYTRGGTGSVPYSTHKRRYHETGLRLHSTLYIIGPTRERTDIIAPEIAVDREAPMFLISTRTEQLVKFEMSGSAWLWGLLGFVPPCVPAAVLLYSGEGAMPYFWSQALGPPLFYLGAFALGWVWMVHNSLVGLRQRVRQGWSLIDVQLKRRHDLIPRLASVVDGLRGHEREVQTAAAHLRTQLVATAPGVAGPDFAGLVASVRMVVEKYPELTARDSFIGLQKELVETEQRIALARDYYNNIATEFATRLLVVPDRWVAQLRRMRPEPLLLAGDFERAVVQIKMA